MTGLPELLKQIARDMQKYEKRKAKVDRAFGRALGQAQMERDEARRLVCEMQAAKKQGTPEGWAREWGWDCFRESPLDRLAKMDEENGL